MATVRDLVRVAARAAEEQQAMRFAAAQADGEMLSYVDALAEARAWLNAFD